MISEISKRYAKALYEIAKDNNSHDKVFAEMNVLSETFKNNPQIYEYIHSPVIASEQKNKSLQEALSGKVSQDTLNILFLLSEKNRLNIFHEIVEAYEFISDEAKGVIRGQVRSATSLNADEKQRVEDTVHKVIKKKVILNFEEDKSILGGVIAQVGGWTFDDSLDSHLTTISENLNRSTH